MTNIGLDFIDCFFWYYTSTVPVDQETKIDNLIKKLMENFNEGDGSKRWNEKQD